jgi:uncharacterized protein (UPF0335 family)
VTASPPTVEELTPHQRRALRHRQLGMFVPDSVHGPGSSLAALRRRGVIAGRQPHAEVTPHGEQLCRELDQQKGKLIMAEGPVAADQLRLFIERIERLEEEKKALADDVRDVYSEAKANGYDSKIMRMIVRLRRLETHTRQEQDALLETYRSALGLA